MKLIGNKILITGVAKGGIGEAFMENIIDSNEIVISSLHMTKTRYPNVKSLKADCTEQNDVDKLEMFINDEMGGLNMLVNCIGGSLKSMDPLSVDKDFFEKVISVNLTTSFLLTQMAARLMINGGSIVHIVSSSAFEPEIKKMPYGISKAGQVYMIKSMAKVLAKKNIRINGVSPTYVYTARHEKEIKEESELSGNTIDQIKSKKLQKQLLQSPLLPDDLNEMIMFALTSQIMTGNILHATLGRIL